MKKTLLSLILAGLLTGCGDNPNNSPESLAEFEKDYLHILQANQTLLGDVLPITHELTISEETVNNTNEYEYNQSTTILENHPDKVSIEVKEVGGVSLNGYDDKKGVATITGESVMTVLYHDDDLFTDVLGPANLSETIDKKKQQYKSELTYSNSPKEIFLMSAEGVVEDSTDNPFSFDQLKITNNISYQDNFTKLNDASIKLMLDNFKVTIDDFYSENIYSIDNLSIENNYNRQSAAMDSTLTIDKASMKTDELSVDLNQFKCTMTLSTDDESQLSDEISICNIENIQVNMENQSTNWGVAEASTRLYDLKIDDFEEYYKGLVNSYIRLFQSIIYDDYSDEEMLYEDFLTLAHLLTENTSFNMNIKLTSASGDNASFDVTIEAQNNINELIAQVQSGSIYSPHQALKYIKRINLSVQFDDDYVIEQAVNVAKLNNEPENKVRQQVKGTLGSMASMIDVFLPEGPNPLVRTDKGHSIEIQYKEGSWDINGQSITTDEITKLLDNL